MATECLCYYLMDDENLVDALKQAIEEHDSPELVRVQPYDNRDPGGLWVRCDRVTRAELEKGKARNRYYRDDRSTFQWIWSPDERPLAMRPVSVPDGATTDVRINTRDCEPMDAGASRAIADAADAIQKRFGKDQ